MTDRDPCVLIISPESDWSAQRIAEALDRRGTRCEWFDPSTFPMRAGLSVTLSGGWRAAFARTDLPWEQMTAVLYRRPRDFQFPEAMSEPERRFARAQARVAIGGVLGSLPVRWISHPSALADAEYKPRQLALAEHLGLSVPPTLITTRADDVRRLAAEHGTLITKPLTMPIVDEDNGQTIAWTHRVSPGELDELPGIELTAHLFQPEIEKDYEVRLIAVGAHIFAVAIHAHSPAARLDWRRDYDSLSYAVIEVPQDILQASHAFLARSGLLFGAFDFIVRPDGEWVFLECNAGGQWGWLAEECNLPIAEAFAAELAGGSCP